MRVSRRHCKNVSSQFSVSCRTESMLRVVCDKLKCRAVDVLANIRKFKNANLVSSSIHSNGQRDTVAGLCI